MGRELRRVPMDFDWPLDEVWGGYLTPEKFQFPECPSCGGDGLGPEAQAIANTFYPYQVGGSEAEKLAWHDKIGQAEVDNLVAKNRLSTLVKREPTDDNPRDWEWVALPRTAEEINALNSRGSLSVLDGHDAINRWILVEFRCERLGIPHLCRECQGHGNVATDEQRRAAENNEWVEPPEGGGYQLWETTTEGSPQTPVFATLEELCEYAATNVSTFGRTYVSADEWREMLDEGFVRTEETMPDGTKVVYI